jgi:predicted regulator of Ras-like GTPase activity (Roadblock/LC7/MglB family)
METLLRQLLDIEGVTGAALIGADGLLVAGLFESQRADSHAANAAAVFDALLRYARHLGAGSPRQALIEMANTLVCLTEAGELILTVEAASTVNLGRLRRESLRVAHALVERSRG